MKKEVVEEESKYQKRRRKRALRRQQILCIAASTLCLLGSLAFAYHIMMRMKTATSSMNTVNDIHSTRLWRSKIIQQQHSITSLTNPIVPHRKVTTDDEQEDTTNIKPKNPKDSISKELDQLDADIRSNHHGGIRWIRPNLLKELPGQSRNLQLNGNGPRFKSRMKGVFSVRRDKEGPMVWEQEWKEIKGKRNGPKVDYTKIKYTYPDKLWSVPKQGGYPQLDKLGDILERYPQDDLDHPPQPFVEKLLHFNYSNPRERQAAELFRDAELPFKVFDIPDIPTEKWTDEYIITHFDKNGFMRAPKAQGIAQESVNNFFAFFTPNAWNVDVMGPPPSRNNDWTFQKWSEHAKYADHVGLDFDQPHFYWQAGAEKSERYEPKSKWTFITKDLPMLSSPTPTFFVFNPDEQKGIQCRFGERGVTAATHYDSGRNMVAMITGAKRYILSPPRECSKLGIVTSRGNSIFRHSLLNFGHISYLDTNETMSPQERAWLERSSQSDAIDTILKAGEVLYIPSHWFHYVTSVQKSAQCNVRSGVENEGTEEFGGLKNVRTCLDDTEEIEE